MNSKDPNDSEGLRVIQTARTEYAINKAANKGFRPLMRVVERSPDISHKFCVWQNETTGKIKVAGDFRDGPRGTGWKQVIEWTDFYPYAFPEPFAAYLIPADLEPGEYVFLEDLIEDIVGSKSNQGDKSRLESCRALWDGSDLTIDYTPPNERWTRVG